MKMSVEEFLESLPDETRMITKHLRLTAKAILKGAHEIVSHNALSFGTTASLKDCICYIAPQKKGYVNFGFFYGGSLEDPERMLTGPGKSLKYIKIRSVAEAKNKNLKLLIAGAWQNGKDGVAGMRKGHTRLRS